MVGSLDRRLSFGHCQGMQCILCMHSSMHTKLLFYALHSEMICFYNKWCSIHLMYTFILAEIICIHNVYYTHAWYLSAAIKCITLKMYNITQMIMKSILYNGTGFAARHRVPSTLIDELQPYIETFFKNKNDNFYNNRIRILV